MRILILRRQLLSFRPAFVVTLLAGPIVHAAGDAANPPTVSQPAASLEGEPTPSPVDTQIQTQAVSELVPPIIKRSFWEKRKYHLGIEALTDFPVQVGGKLWVEFPGRVRLSSSFGYLPGVYVDAINAVLVAAHAYSSSDATLIRQTLQSSFVWRIHAGWRPLRKRGFYFEVGYGLVTLGGSTTTAALLSAASNKMVPTDVGSNRGYSVDSTLHMIDAEIGWQWILGKGFSLRTALGFAGTLGSQTTVKPNFQPLNPTAQSNFTAASAQYLDHIYTSYVFTPVATVAAGWAMF